MIYAEIVDQSHERVFVRCPFCKQIHMYGIDIRTPSTINRLCLNGSDSFMIELDRG